jgi:uncharacterized protein (DUF433 family)
MRRKYAPRADLLLRSAAAARRKACAARLTTRLVLPLNEVAFAAARDAPELRLAAAECWRDTIPHRAPNCAPFLVPDQSEVVHRGHRRDVLVEFAPLRLSALDHQGQEYDCRLIDWSTCSAVERDPAVVSGAWVFRGTRIPVAALFENLEDGASVQQFVEWFPGVELEQARVVLEHAARSSLAVA